MKISGFGKEEPEFFNIDEEIRKLLNETSQHDTRRKEINVKYINKNASIQAKIDELRASLLKLNSDMAKEYQKEDQDYAEKTAKLAALRKQKEEEAKNKQFDETVRLIKEICEEFAAWHNARDYQVEDVVRIVHQYIIGSSGVMNANEMALGKTFETLVALFIIMELHKRKTDQKPRMLWLTKDSIVRTGGTFNEARRWFPELRMFPLKGSDSKAAREMTLNIASKGGICILTNYELVRTTEVVKDTFWDIVIMDEVHKLKGGANASGPTAIWEAVKSLKYGFQIMLTGTPIVNRIEEIWSYLHIFDPVTFNDAKKFTRDFSAFRDFSGKIKFDLRSENLLKEILKGRLIRRTATEVGLQLPPVNMQDIVIEHNPEQGKIYQQIRERFFIWLDKQDKALPITSILAQLTRLRQVNVLPVANFVITDEETGEKEEFKLDVRDSSKMDTAIELIQATNDQVIVFSNFVEPMEELALRIQVEGLRPEIISSKYKDKMGDYETGFQNGDINVLLIQSGMGEGLNLHKDKAKWQGGARAVIFLDEWWNNARNDQCMKRAIRPGENAGEPVFVYKLMVEHSVDFYIRQICEDKSSQFDVLTESSGLRPSADWKKYLQELL